MKIPSIGNAPETPSPEPSVTLRGKILEARYYPEEGYIAVHLHMEDGSQRRTYLPKTAFLFGGKPPDQVSPKEVDREMNKTAELFMKARGKVIRVAMDESQARLS
jgi:hypothetical protein